MYHLLFGKRQELACAAGVPNMSISENLAYVTTHQLAIRTGIAKSTWEKRRLTGDGPRFIKAGRRVLYRWGDVEAWLLKQARTSTSDAA